MLVETAATWCAFAPLCLIEYTNEGGTRLRNASEEASKDAKAQYCRASSACRFAGGDKVAARTILAERSLARPTTSRLRPSWCPKLLVRRSRRLLRGGGGGGGGGGGVAGECYRGRRRKRSPVAPRRRVRLSGVLFDSISSRGALAYQAPATTVNASRISYPPSTPTPSGVCWQGHDSRLAPERR